MNSRVLFLVTPEMVHVFESLKQGLTDVDAHVARPRSSRTTLPNPQLISRVRPDLIVLLIGASGFDQAVGVRALNNVLEHRKNSLGQRYGVLCDPSFMVLAPEESPARATFWVSLAGRVPQLVRESGSRIRRALDDMQRARDQFKQTARAFGNILGTRDS